jgi:hypothetical protein
MRRFDRVLLFAACYGGLWIGAAAATPLFQIRSADIPYRNVGTDAFYEQFNLEIDDPIAGEELFVELTPHLPGDWLSQFCVTSNGSCFLYSHAITIPQNGHERIQIDFILPLSHEPGMGWIDVRIYRVNDPTTWQEVYFAVGYGVTLPVSRFSFSSGNVFQQADPNTTVQFTSTIRSWDNFNDQLIATVTSDMPSGWFAQFCQVSTGVCYFSNAVIPFPAYAVDELQVDFFCFNPDPAIGNFRLRLQSAANPAMSAVLSFRVRTGQITADVGDDVAATPFTAAITPNPVRDNSEICLDLGRPMDVQFHLTDISGRTIVDRSLPSMTAGTHRVPWDGTDDQGRPLPSGTYFYRLTDGREQAAGKITIGR